MKKLRSGGSTVMFIVGTVFTIAAVVAAAGFLIATSYMPPFYHLLDPMPRAHYGLLLTRRLLAPLKRSRAEPTSCPAPSSRHSRPYSLAN